MVGPIAVGMNWAAWTSPIAFAIFSRGPIEIASAIAIGVKPHQRPGPPAYGGLKAVADLTELAEERTGESLVRASEQLQEAIRLGTEIPFAIETPLMWRSKGETWALAQELGGVRGRLFGERSARVSR